MVDTKTAKVHESEKGDSPLTERLSRNIATCRRALELTQAQLAERLGVDTETLSRFERGKHLPSLITLERLASILQTTVAELLAEAPKEADKEALAYTLWLSALSPADRAFVRGVMKQCCDYLATRDAAPAVIGG